MDRTTEREDAVTLLAHYERTGRVSKAEAQRKRLEWMNSDEIRIVYRYVCEGHPLNTCIFDSREDIQDWIDECLDDCPGCECGHIEETTMSGRDFGDLVMTEA